MLITVLMFIFSKFFSFIFLGQIWFQNLKFYRFIEIWCKGTLLYAYCDFNVYFLKSLVIHIILDKFSHKIWCCPSWPEPSNSVHCNYYMLITIESYNFLQIFCSKCYGKISFHLVFSILTELYRIFMLNFSKYEEQQILGWNFPKKLMNGNTSKNYASKP